ncbi:MAG: hypothetical protein ABL959_08780 [Pyrinomonadaceae bacterium]
MLKKFIRWETPFTDTKYPSAVVITGPNDKDCPVEVVVAPSGWDKYPKYVVDFGETIAFSCMEEMHFPERDFAEAETEDEGLSAYEFINSTWLEAYRDGEFFLFNTKEGDDEQLRHFLILGGDNYIEVITKNTPSIRRVDGAKVEARAFAI